MNDVAVVVSSFDGFAATWEPFCHGFRKYWPDCPWPLKFITNQLDSPCGETIKTGEGRNWMAMTRKALILINKFIVLWLHDDIWLIDRPDTEAILDFANIIRLGKADYIRLGPCRLDYDVGIENMLTFESDPRLFIVPADYEYRVSLQAALWRVSVFQDLLRDGESCWAFEVNGSKRARSNNQRFLCAKEFVLRNPRIVEPDWTDEPVRRGQWTEGARQYISREGLSIDIKTLAGPVVMEKTK